MAPVNVIPALMPGQSIQDWGRLYKRATALFASDKQKIDSLPVYVCRNEGEVEIALLVVEENTDGDLDKALKRLSELVDGKPSRVLAAQKFFECPVTGERKTTFFILKKLGKEAEFSNDVVLLRFLSLLPSGVKFYEDNKSKIKAAMTDAELLEMFALLQPQLDKAQKQTKQETQIIIKQEKDDGFVFAADSEENLRPVDYTGELDALKGELDSIKHYLLDQNEGNWAEERECDETEAEEVYYAYNGAQNRQKSTRRCYICDRQGHMATQCFKRKCRACGKLGHSTHECEEKKSGGYSGGYSRGSSSSMGHPEGQSRGNRQRPQQKDNGRRANL